MRIFEDIKEKKAIVLITGREDGDVVVDVLADTFVDAIFVDIDKENAGGSSNILTTAGECFLPTHEEFLLFEYMIAEFGVSLGNIEFLLLKTHFVEVARLTEIDQIVTSQRIDGTAIGIGKNFMTGGRTTTQTHTITSDMNASIEDEITVNHRIVIYDIHSILRASGFDILRLGRSGHIVESDTGKTIDEIDVVGNAGASETRDEIFVEHVELILANLIIGAPDYAIGLKVEAENLVRHIAEFGQAVFIA